MKTITKKVGERDVNIAIKRMALQPGCPYEQRITASCEGHVLRHRVSHDPTKFNAADAKNEIDRIVDELASRVAGMCDVKTFLDSFEPAGDGVDTPQ